MSPVPPDAQTASPAPPDRAAVGASTLRLVRAIAEALFATEAGPPPARRLDWLQGEVSDFLARIGTRSRLVFVFMVRLVSWLAPLLSGKLALLPSLGLEERVRALTLLERRFGEPLLAIKAILCLIYYEHPDAQAQIGFDARCADGSRQLPAASAAQRSEHARA